MKIWGKNKKTEKKNNDAILLDDTYLYMYIMTQYTICAIHAIRYNNHHKPPQTTTNHHLCTITFHSTLHVSTCTD